MGVKKDLAKAQVYLKTAESAEQLTDALDAVRAADKIVAAASASFEAKKKKQVLALLIKAKAQLEIFKNWIGGAAGERNPMAAFQKQVNDLRKVCTSLKGQVNKD